MTLRIPLQILNELLLCVTRNHVPPRRIYRRNLVKRIVEKHVAQAIEEYKRRELTQTMLVDLYSKIDGGAVTPGCMDCAEDDKDLLMLIRSLSNVKAMMTTEYCPATEIQRMEQELDLTLKGNDIEAPAKGRGYAEDYHGAILQGAS
ncbi:hypothetical protein Tco_1316960 [Tanacetum coccineum]